MWVAPAFLEAIVAGSVFKDVKGLKINMGMLLVPLEFRNIF